MAGLVFSFLALLPVAQASPASGDVGLAKGALALAQAFETLGKQLGARPSNSAGVTLGEVTALKAMFTAMDTSLQTIWSDARFKLSTEARSGLSVIIKRLRVISKGMHFDTPQTLSEQLTALARDVRTRMEPIAAAKPSLFERLIPKAPTPAQVAVHDAAVGSLARAAIDSVLALKINTTRAGSNDPAAEATRLTRRQEIRVTPEADLHFDFWNGVETILRDYETSVQQLKFEAGKNMLERKNVSSLFADAQKVVGALSNQPVRMTEGELTPLGETESVRSRTTFEKLQLLSASSPFCERLLKHR